MLASQVRVRSSIRWKRASESAYDTRKRNASGENAGARWCDRSKVGTFNGRYRGLVDGADTTSSSSDGSVVHGVVSHGKMVDEEESRGAVSVAKKFVWKDATQTRPLGVFKCATYNVMADAYSEPAPGRVTTPKPYVGGRISLVLKELENLGADVLCLQEVESGLVDTYFRPFLESRGYNLTFHVKARAKDPLTPENWKPRVDGLLTAWRTAKFQELSSTNFELRELLFEHPKKWGVERKTMQSLLRLDTPVTVTILETTHVKASKKLLCVANIHGHAGGENAKPLLNSIQTQMALHAAKKVMFAHFGMNSKKIEADAPAPMPFIFAGDFNARPGSGTYQLLANGSLPHDSHWLTYSPGKQSTDIDLVHYLRLQSAYGNSIFGEPPQTHHSSPVLNGTLDYLWYTPSYLSVHRLLDVPDLSERSGLRLPTTEFPSDHLPIGAEFSFNPSLSLEDQHTRAPKTIEEPTFVRSAYKDGREPDRKPKTIVLQKPAAAAIGDEEFDHDTQIAKTPSKKRGEVRGRGRPPKSKK